MRIGVDRDDDGIRDADDATLDPPTTTTTSSTTSTSTSSSTSTSTTSTTGTGHPLITIPPLTTNTLFHLPIPLGDPPPFLPGEAPRIH